MALISTTSEFSLCYAYYLVLSWAIIHVTCGHTIAGFLRRDRERKKGRDGLSIMIGIFFGGRPESTSSKWWKKDGIISQNMCRPESTSS